MGFFKFKKLKTLLGFYPTSYFEGQLLKKLIWKHVKSLE
jgi:hypothetical protein